MTAMAPINAMMASAVRGSRMDIKGWRPVAVAIIFATLVGGWMFRYEPVYRTLHQNRFTGAVCHISEECWFESIFSVSRTATPAPAPIDDWVPVPPVSATAAN
jgi:hypothetical protein